jgi:hypothetical protein
MTMTMVAVEIFLMELTSKPKSTAIHGRRMKSKANLSLWQQRPGQAIRGSL